MASPSGSGRADTVPEIGPSTALKPAARFANVCRIAARRPRCRGMVRSAAVFSATWTNRWTGNWDTTAVAVSPRIGS